MMKGAVSDFINAAATPRRRLTVTLFATSTGKSYSEGLGSGQYEVGGVAGGGGGRWGVGVGLESEKMSDQEMAAAIELRESIAKQRAKAQADHDLDSALLRAQLDGAIYVLDCLGAPRWQGQRLLSVDLRIKALRSRLGQTAQSGGAGAMKLFKVTCRGMHSSHGIAYVVAIDADRAYRRVRDDLDARDLGFEKDRELLSVELVADDAAYPDCQVRVYLGRAS